MRETAAGGRVARAGCHGLELGHLREIMDIVLNAVRPLRCLVLTLAVAALGCHAQTGAQAAGPEAGGKLSPELARRIEVMIRSQSEVPPEYAISISDRKKSDVPGYDQVTVSFSANGNTSRPSNFLVSTDGKTLAQFKKFDISEDPKNKVSSAGRPARGGPESAPVAVVVFDDLECPYCAKLNAALFPAVVERYKNQVHVVYRDFPLSQHPWAMRAAIDANCLAAASPAGYWNVVDYVHAHSGEIGGDERSVAKANSALDKLVEDEGGRQKVNAADLEACIKKQDDAKVKESMKEADALGVESTPALFINGEKVEGAIPMEYIYRVIDGALTAAGQTPPPAPVEPAAAPAPGTKPGS